MAKTAISSAMGVGKSRKATELRRSWPGGSSALLVDPLGFDAGDSNLYRYVNNAPSNSADPSGLQPDPLDLGGLKRFLKEQEDFLRDFPDHLRDHPFEIPLGDFGAKATSTLTYVARGDQLKWSYKELPGGTDEKTKMIQVLVSVTPRSFSADFESIPLVERHVFSSGSIWFDSEKNWGLKLKTTYNFDAAAGDVNFEVSPGGILACAKFAANLDATHVVKADFKYDVLERKLFATFTGEVPLTEFGTVLRAGGEIQGNRVKFFGAVQSRGFEFGLDGNIRDLHDYTVGAYGKWRFGLPGPLHPDQ
jgi:hypothetical protein